MQRQAANTLGRPTYDALGFLLSPSLSPQSQFLSSSYPSPSSSGRVLPKLALYPGIPRAGGGGRLGTGLVRSLLDGAR